MTWIDFMSQFGGNCGLCLGISLLSVVEIFYWFSVKLCKNFKTWGGRDNFLARFLSSAIMPIFYLCLHICLGFSKLCQTIWWNLSWIGCKWWQVCLFTKFHESDEKLLKIVVTLQNCIWLNIEWTCMHYAPLIYMCVLINVFFKTGQSRPSGGKA